mgnify:CR=1 FL=1
MAEWIVENWFIIVALAAVAGGVACAIYKFAGLPTKEQVAKIKQWLLLAVTTKGTRKRNRSTQTQICVRPIHQQVSGGSKDCLICDVLHVGGRGT